MWESVRGRFEQDLVKTEKNYFSTSARMLLNLGLNYKRTLPFMRTVKGQFAGTNMIGFILPSIYSSQEFGNKTSQGLQMLFLVTLY